MLMGARRQSRLLRLALPWFVALLLGSHAPAAADTAVRPQKVEPAVLMWNGALEGCGLVAHFETAGNRVAVDLIARRREGGIEHVLSGRWLAPSGMPVPLRDLFLETSRLDTRTHFAAPASDAKDGVMAIGRLDPVEGDLFIQEVMVIGARLTITASDGTVLPLELAGPLPQLVRASYLNCAGDLYRP